MPIRSAFVTGATGLLGNNLVRLLVSRGVHVRGRTRRELGVAFLPVEETLRETISGYSEIGWLENLNVRGTAFHPAGESTC